ncbi:GTPase [Corynebacterium suedekumii]|uniref:50S ribosome-binding GTPase n=1 Tax=Corynebacterium suedekumii TaxID=3049801 RepID=A0ABY8VNW0_9CORY|nr:GTPase [Corynebacterium suedekumii]WIM71321.1 50S ribosome-binding GTPase [Corynebacterium suedekumii]
MFGRKHSLSERLSALDDAAALGAEYLSPAEHAALTRVADAAGERRELSAEHTVVGFFGATGSGKTSLFNAVVGEDLGRTAARRPTTSSPLAAVWDPVGSEELLNWLEVEDRRNRPGEFAPKAGPLILLDLPDFDSVEPVHREIATRLAGQVDVLVWVTDPEKYADSIIHDHFIRPHASHSAVTLAVLNKSDKLSEPDRKAVAGSLEQLLREDGLKKVSVIPTSAKTGDGVEDLRRAIARVAAAHTAQTARIEADLATVTAPWAGQKPLKEVPASAKRRMDELLADAAGADRLATVTAAAYRKRLGQKTGWLLTSWMLRLRADPLRRLGLREEADETGVHRSSLPALDASGRAVANRGVRGYAADVAEGLPDRWAGAVVDRTETIVDELPEELDRAAARTTLPAQPSGAWGLFTVIQWLALLAALVGVAWYLLAAFLPGALYPLMDDIIPEIEGWPIPTLLILGGLLLGILLGLFTGVFGLAIGNGVKRRTRRALRKEVAEISAAEVVEPLAEIRSRYARFLEKIHVAAGR